MIREYSAYDATVFSATSAGSSFISGTLFPTSSIFPSTMTFLSVAYAFSISSFTTTASYAPGVRAYSISAVEASSRRVSDSTDSVPRPERRERSEESEGGERKTKMGERDGWLALMSFTPYSDENESQDTGLGFSCGIAEKRRSRGNVPGYRYQGCTASLAHRRP